VRVTVDIDGGVLNLLKAFFTMKYYFGNCYVRRSPSGRGWHLMSFTPIKDFDKILQIRRALGDDEARIHFDEKRLKKPKQVLWTVKDGNAAGEWWDDVERVL